MAHSPDTKKHEFFFQKTAAQGFSQKFIKVLINVQNINFFTFPFNSPNQEMQTETLKLNLMQMQNSFHIYAIKLKKNLLTMNETQIQTWTYCTYKNNYFCQFCCDLKVKFIK